MARLGKKYEHRLAALYAKVIDALDRDLESEVAYLRSQAQDRALRLIRASDKARGLLAQAVPAQTQTGQYTLTEVLMVLRQVQTQRLGKAMETRETGLMGELAQRFGPQLPAAYKEALASARRDLACDIPEARAAARGFLEREAACEAIRRRGPPRAASTP